MWTFILWLILLVVCWPLALLALAKALTDLPWLSSAVFAEQPDVVLLGTGAANIFPPRELTFAFARRGIGLEVMDTAAAARTFNVLANEGRRVAAVLYI